MSEGEKAAILLASRLFEYPDEDWFLGLPQIKAETLQTLEPEKAKVIEAFCANLQATDPAAFKEDYVRVFDHDPAGSLYLTWHRYGNDRSQGRAMAALNGLYRAAGFEPVQGTLPDYLPRMLEFMAICEEWALEAMLDGFGPELEKLLQNLCEQNSPHAAILKMALEPLKRDFPEQFKPRTKPDSTIRPMARPEAENLGIH